MALAPYPIQPVLSAISLKYRNTRLIADAVSPRIPVGSPSFKYWKHDLTEGFTIPDTKVGRRGAPGQVEFNATEVPAAVADYGLSAPVPQSDIDAAPPGHDPLARATEGVTDLILLDRERRVAAQVHGTGSYAGGNQVTLSGTSQWSDYTNSDPIAAIATGLDGVIMRPNVGVIGRAAFTKLQSHPKIVKAILGNAGDAGRVSAAAIAQLFELDELLVGEGWYNSAKKGQAATMVRVWGKHMALIYRDGLADASGNRASFAWTAQFGDRFAAMAFDKDIGLMGGYDVRVGERVQEVISAPDLGYLMLNVVA